MSIDTMLREEIQDEITRLGKMELGSEMYKTTVDGVTKLLDRANEMKKIDAEARDRAESREIEIQFKNEQMQDDKKDRIVKNILTALSIGMGLEKGFILPSRGLMMLFTISFYYISFSVCANSAIMQGRLYIFQVNICYCELI